MRFMCDEFRSSHTDEQGGYLPTSIEEFEITIMTHFLKHPDWLGNAPRGIIRTWALDEILTTHFAPKRSTLSLMWFEFRQWIRRKFNLVVRMSDEQKEYYKLMVYLFGIKRDIKFIKDISELRVLLPSINYGTVILKAENDPIMLCPVKVSDKNFEYILGTIYIFDDENIEGDAVARFLAMAAQSIKDDEERQCDKVTENDVNE